MEAAHGLSCPAPCGLARSPLPAPFPSDTPLLRGGLVVRHRVESPDLVSVEAEACNRFPIGPLSVRRHPVDAHLRNGLAHPRHLIPELGHELWERCAGDHLSPDPDDLEVVNPDVSCLARLPQRQEEEPESPSFSAERRLVRSRSANAPTLKAAGGGAERESDSRSPELLTQSVAAAVTRH